ncbi:hypothetical protein PLICRDRAFT_149354 [Plicaturopsis crispa FD-325 SS-3]|nr:hypothetical protein PLICRDRAFT_149354 [Plicaturopsis crispa FD-325 SS-3]
MGLPIAPNFFTPHARGKGKAVEEFEYERERDCDQCARFPTGNEDVCNARHSLWCSKRNRLFMMKEVIPCRDRPLRRRTRQYLSNASNKVASTSSLLLNNPRVTPRRHASYSSQAQPPPETPKPPEELDFALRDFAAVCQQSTDAFDLEASWDVYTRVVDLGGKSRLEVPEMLAFAGRTASRVELLYNSSGSNLGDMHQWGSRLRALLAGIESEIPPQSAHRYSWTCLSLRAMALSGEPRLAGTRISEIADMPDGYVDTGESVLVYNRIVQSISRHFDALAVVDFLADQWSILGGYVATGLYPHSSPVVWEQLVSFKETVWKILETVDNPRLVVRRRLENVPWEERSGVADLLCRVMCHFKLADEAYDLLQEMIKLKLRVWHTLKMTVVRSLAQANAFDRANALFEESYRNVRTAYTPSTGLHLFAHQGNIERAEEFYSILDANNWVSESDTAMLMHAYAAVGRTEKVVALFEEFFGEDGHRQQPPTMIHFSIVIYAHAQACDFPGINHWLDIMTQAGFKPGHYVYTAILKSFAMRGDVDSIAVVLDQMRAARLNPTQASYTIVISFLAKRGDPIAAEAMYNRAIDEGVVPDRRMVNSLMYAHVNAGSWKGAIRAFDYLVSSRSRHRQLTIEVYNTLLKAYVLIGAPFRIVSALFDKLTKTNVKPDERTFCLLIQSACDGQLMDIASNIFTEMDRMATEGHLDIRINAYVLTIIMSGFLRMGDKVRAKAVYDDMRERKIQPTSVTFAAILKAYGNEGTEESLRIAEEFLNSLMVGEEGVRAWLEPDFSRSTGLVYVYRPLMDVFARQQNPEEVERLFQAMLDAGGEPTLGALTALLDAYRRTQNIEAGRQIWLQIFQLGLRYSRVDALVESDSKRTYLRRQANILCIPLSIYVDLLSSAGEHLEIATTWRKLKLEGFAFDSHNWNHLVVALVRAGEPERAFGVLEKVILPYQREAKKLLSARDRHPGTPLSFAVEVHFPPTDDSPTEIANVARHDAERRVTDARHTEANLRETPWMAPEEWENNEDFAHPLHVLRQISPSWNVWAPHKATLSVLSMVLGRLESGLPVEALEAGEQRSQSLGDDPGIREQKSELAIRTLENIMRDFPHTVDAVRDYERTLIRKMGYKRFEAL